MLQSPVHLGKVMPGSPPPRACAGTDISALSGACASIPHCLLQLLFPRVEHDANPRLSQPANHLAKFDQFLIGHEAQTFAQLLQFGLRWIQKQWTSPGSPAEVG